MVQLRKSSDIQESVVKNNLLKKYAKFLLIKFNLHACVHNFYAKQTLNSTNSLLSAELKLLKTGRQLLHEFNVRYFDGHVFVHGQVVKIRQNLQQIPAKIKLLMFKFAPAWMWNLRRISG